MPPVNEIEQICRCPGDRVECPKILPEFPKAFKLCYLQQDDKHVTLSYVGCHNNVEAIFKIRSKNAFFTAFLIMPQHPAQ